MLAAVMLQDLLPSRMTTVTFLIMCVLLKSNGQKFVSSVMITEWYLLLMMFAPASALILPVQTIIMALKQTLSAFVKHLQTAIICQLFAVVSI